MPVTIKKSRIDKLCADYLALKDELAHLQEDFDSLKDEIISAMDNEQVLVGKNYLATYTNSPQERINVQLLRAKMKSTEITQFLKKTDKWTLTVTKKEAA